MRALLSHRAGGPETLVLEDVPEPAVGPDGVRIAVHACSVNFPDLLIIQDLYQDKPPRPFIPGGEVAGVVEAIGAGVDKVRPGDRVLMSPVRGGMAQKVVGAAAACWKIPDTMPFDEAAALLLTYGTSQHALQDRAQLRAGETLLVLGAGGGVGLAAVEGLHLFYHGHRQVPTALRAFIDMIRAPKSITRTRSLKKVFES